MKKETEFKFRKFHLLEVKEVNDDTLDHYYQHKVMSLTSSEAITSITSLTSKDINFDNFRKLKTV